MKKNRGKILDIRVIGDKVLREIAKPVEEITPEIKEFIKDLIATMYEKDGIGLAAPQVGRSLRIFIVDPDVHKEDAKPNPHVFINPRFTLMEDETTYDEGCLSVPEIFEKVKRYKKVSIEALDEHGELRKYDAEEVFAIALQHEYDHLDGILFIDRLPKIKQLTLKHKLKMLMKTTDENGVNIRVDEDE